MKYLLFLFSLIACSLAASQELNNYKYVLVSNQYEFQSEANQFNFNDLVVFELKKRGFKAYKNSDVLPADINVGTCNGLTADVIKSGLLKVKLELVLKNCTGEVVFQSEGSSKFKEYRAAYFQALRRAMESLDGADYSYTPVTISSDDVIARSTLQKGNTDAATLSAERIASQKDAEQAIIAKPATTQPTPKIAKDIAVENAVKITREVTTDKPVYTSRDKRYLMYVDGVDFSIVEDSRQIGLARKGSSGCYLVTTSKFNGLGTIEDTVFRIEVFTPEGSQIITFNRSVQ